MRRRFIPAPFIFFAYRQIDSGGEVIIIKRAWRQHCHAAEKSAIERIRLHFGVMSMGFRDNVYKIVRRIPKGYVMSYGQVAALAGNAGAPRAAGYAMYQCPFDDMPCHRVVYADGRLAGEVFFGAGRQRALLEAEGVSFTEDGRVDMSRHRWRGVIKP